MEDYEHADQFVFDLDPGERVPWDLVIETALSMRGLLESEGLAGWPKTTGGKGLHVVAKAHGFDKRLAQCFAATDAGRYITVADQAKRGGRIFIVTFATGAGRRPSALIRLGRVPAF